MLKSSQENIDTGNPTGKLIFHIFGALSEFKRNLNVERANAGLKAARVRWIKGGENQNLMQLNKKRHKRGMMLKIIRLKKFVKP